MAEDKFEDDDDHDADDEMRGSNDGAYEKGQVRMGPPLEYVAEKLRHGVEATHFVLAALRRQHGSESLIFNASYAFRSQITAYLALNNFLALVNDEGFFERLEGYSKEQFEDWLRRIDQQGSVT
jgi:hypothetical protein